MMMMMCWWYSKDLGIMIDNMEMMTREISMCIL